MWKNLISESTYRVFLTLGIIWLIVGLIIYDDAGVWPLGFIFLVIGLIGLFSKKWGNRKN